MSRQSIICFWIFLLHLGGYSVMCVSAQTLFVSAIIDGERLVLSDGARVELIGVDAIEKFTGGGVLLDVQRFGVDAESVRKKGGIASAYVSFLVNSRWVQVNYQIEEDENVSYGNKFKPAFLTVLDEKGHLDFVLNKRIIEDGYAFVDPNISEAFKEQFITLQKRAMQEQKGLWARGAQIEKKAMAGTAESSKNADPNSTCRFIKGCVWKSSGSHTTGGRWESLVGYACPCAK